jgi:hypothetical protein
MTTWAKAHPQCRLQPREWGGWAVIFSNGSVKLTSATAAIMLWIYSLQIMFRLKLLAVTGAKVFAVGTEGKRRRPGLCLLFFLFLLQ